MKVKINPIELSKSLQKAIRAISSKNALAILDNFLIAIQGERLTVTASDIEVRISIATPIIESDCDFNFCVNAKTFTQGITSLKGESVEIELLEKSNELVCYHNKGRFNIAYLNSDEYPQPQDNGEGVTFDISFEDLNSLIQEVSYACGNDPIHIMFNGVYFDLHDNMVTGVATNGAMLVKTNKNVIQNNGANSFIMPQKVTTIIPMLCENPQAVINFDVHGSSYVNLKVSDDFEVSFRQINGKFPNYNAVFPKDVPTTTTINRNDLIESLSRGMFFSTKTKLASLLISNNNASLSTRDIDFSLASEETLDCDSNIVDEMKIGFNGEKFLSILKAMQGDNIVLGINDPSKTITIQAPDQPHLIALIMPMKID